MNDVEFNSSNHSQTFEKYRNILEGVKFYPNGKNGKILLRFYNPVDERDMYLMTQFLYDEEFNYINNKRMEHSIPILKRLVYVGLFKPVNTLQEKIQEEKTYNLLHPLNQTEILNKINEMCKGIETGWEFEIG